MPDKMSVIMDRSEMARFYGYLHGVRRGGNLVSEWLLDLSVAYNKDRGQHKFIIVFSEDDMRHLWENCQNSNDDGFSDKIIKIMDMIRLLIFKRHGDGLTHE